MMKVKWSIEAMEKELGKGEETVDDWEQFSSMMTNLRKEYGTWCTIKIEFLPEEK